MKTLLISGGSSGIGLATAIQAIEKKQFDAIYILDIQEPKLNNSKSIININQLNYIECDVTDYQQVKSAIDKIAQTQPITHLFVCAAVLESNRLENTTADRIQQVININLAGAIFVLKATLPYMQNNNKGNIVLTGSDQSFVGKSGNSIYGCTKAAVANLAKSMAVENAQYNIRVNCLCPGTIDTPFYQQASLRYATKNNLDIEKVRASLAREQPVGRIGTPEEVAELALFLLSDQASFMTGSVIPIDGGYTAQ